MVASLQSHGISALSETRNYSFEVDPAANTFATLNPAKRVLPAVMPSYYYDDDDDTANSNAAAAALDIPASQVVRSASAANASSDNVQASAGGICSSSSCVAVMGSAVAGVVLVALVAVGLLVYRRKRAMDQERSRRIHEAPNGRVRILVAGSPKHVTEFRVKTPTLANPPKAAFAFSTTGGSRNIVTPAQGGNGPGWTMDLFSDSLSDDDSDDNSSVSNVDLEKNLPSIPEDATVVTLPPTRPKAASRPPMIKVPASNFSRTPRPPSIVASYTVPPTDNAYARPMLSPITPLLSPRMHLDMGPAGAAVFGNTGYARGGVRESAGSSYLQSGTGVGPRKLTLPSGGQAANQRRSIDGVW